MKNCLSLRIVNCYARIYSDTPSAWQLQSTKGWCTNGSSPWFDQWLCAGFTLNRENYFLEYYCLSLVYFASLLFLPWFEYNNSVLDFALFLLQVVPVWLLLSRLDLLVETMSLLLDESHTARAQVFLLVIITHWPDSPLQSETIDTFHVNSKYNPPLTIQVCYC